jgi:1-acyl-sn-glycerol-3-phosphate acyltransferase
MSVQTLPARAARPSAGLIARSAAFNTAALVWMVALILIAVPCLLLPRGAILSISRLWMGGVQFLLRHLAGLTYEVRGLERAPATPAIYAFKHQSAWETLTTHLLVPDAAIALKRELTQIPLFGWYVRHAGMIGVDRSGGTKALRSLVDGARDAFARGVSVIIFPEGHRIAPGRHAPYQAGVAALYTQLKQPVVPVAHNSGMFWGRRSFVKRPGRIVLEFLEPIEPGLDRKAFMAELHRRLEGACDRLIEEAGGLGPSS